MTTQPKQPARMGRPPLPDDKRRDERFELRLTTDEKAKAKRLGARWFYAQLAKAE